MLTLQLIREKKDFVAERLAVKGFQAVGLLDEIIKIDDARRKTQNELDTLLSEANALAKQIGEMMKSGKKAEADDLKNKSSALKETTKQLGEQLSLLEKQQQELLVKLPNIPSPTVPKGKTPEDNEKIHEEGTHDQLVASGGEYAKLFELQAANYR